MRYNKPQGDLIEKHQAYFQQRNENQRRFPNIHLCFGSKVEKATSCGQRPRLNDELLWFPLNRDKWAGSNFAHRQNLFAKKNIYYLTFNNTFVLVNGATDMACIREDINE